MLESEVMVSVGCVLEWCLYNEQNPDDEAIGAVTTADFPDKARCSNRGWYQYEDSDCAADRA